eukprot:SM000084S23142  [mRNA]  locus=s84:331435:335494:- [translate_table: standard]
MRPRRAVPTTMLSGALAAAGGRRIGVLVNDLAEVNVDARVLGQLAGAAGGLAELHGGCICCSAGGGLAAALQKLLSTDGVSEPLDAVVIECSGVAEASNVSNLLAALRGDEEGCPQQAVLDTLVTVVDAGTILRWLDAASGAAGAGTGETALAALMIEQIESADVVILNKADRVPLPKLALCSAAVRALNPRAFLQTTSFGRVPVEVIIATGRRQIGIGASSETGKTGWGYQRGHSHKDKGEEDLRGVADRDEGHHTHAHSQAGHICSFVFEERRPFHMERLHDLVKDLRHHLARVDGSSAMQLGTRGSGSGGDCHTWNGLLRSKGLLWLATLSGPKCMDVLEKSFGPYIDDSSASQSCCQAGDSRKDLLLLQP